MTTTDLKQIAIDAFDLIDWITGTITGGIEAPRIRMDVEEQDENTVVVTWRNPKTCGLSDCRYHNTDLKPHKDVFRLINNKLEYNGKTDDIFGVTDWSECQQRVDDFYTRWRLTRETEVVA